MQLLAFALTNAAQIIASHPGTSLGVTLALIAAYAYFKLKKQY